MYRKMYVWLLILMIALSCVSTTSVSAAGYGKAVIDADSGRLLFGANPHVPLPIASLTKIWTAFVVLENSKLHEEVIISKEATLSEGSSIYLKEGEKTTVETLLYGLMLRSGNDAAYALAEHTGGSIEGFVRLMNEAAFVYGLKSTQFTNPSGLHHENHYSSAYDTAKMLQIALKNQYFYKIATSLAYQSDTENGTMWSNKHRLLHENKQALAGKTGYTKVAGRTLATFFEKDDKRCVVVTLNESNDWQVHETLANHVWEQYEITTVAKQGKYRVIDDVVVKLQTPIQVLATISEQQQLRQVLHLPRDGEQGIWHVFIGNERVQSTIVDVLKK